MDHQCRYVVPDSIFLRKVAVEIWREIFALVCLPIWDDLPFSLAISEVDDPTQQKSFLVETTPFTLAHAVELSLYRYVAGISKGRKEAGLKNSTPCPLNIQVHIEHGMTEDARATWDLLAPHFSRFERLAIQFGEGDIPTPDPFISCRGLDITFNYLSSFTAGFSSKLKTVGIDFPFPLDALPYPQLTSLVIDCILDEDIDDLLRVLQVSKNLHSLTLKTLQDGPNPRFPITPHRVELPSLQTLTINFPQEGDIPLQLSDSMMEALFASFVMPSLSTFALGRALSDLHPGVIDWPSSLFTMLQHSSSTLKNMLLSLQGPYLYKHRNSFQPVSVLLKATPHLQYLELHDRDSSFRPSDFTDPFPSELLLSDLQYTPDSSPVLPKLKSLSVRGIILSSDNVSRILNLATSRSPSHLSRVDGDDVRPLTELHVVYHVPQDLLEFLLEYQTLEAREESKRDGVIVVIEEERLTSARGYLYEE
ncbi:hypothetical protein L218DRAFT_997487 [Marasmius fiardii PR-910]|nr:hypothetical protein L218DRAFT_997487 [Marasmius fiardii PR-910]